MKIIGGILRGRNFYRPAAIRPTQNQVRKAVFDLIGHDLSGLEMVDFFAGSGAVALEALSYKAQLALMVEKDAKSLEVIRENMGLLLSLENAPVPGNAELLTLDAFAAIKVLARQNRRFDIVFVDPPYGRDLAKKALKTLEAYDILRPNSVLVIQHDIKEVLPKPKGLLRLFKSRKYGTTQLSIYRPHPKEDTEALTKG